MAVMMVRARSTSGSIVEAARALDAAIERAARTGDAARLVRDCYAETGRLVPPSGPAVSGVDQIRASWRSILDSGLADIALDTPDVVSTSDAAYGIGRYTLMYRPADGRAIRDAGRRVLAYRRLFDGSWRLTADIWTSDGPTMEQPTRLAQVRGGRGCECRRASGVAHDECRRSRPREHGATRPVGRGAARP